MASDVMPTTGRGRTLLTLQALVDHPAVLGVALGACVDGSKWNAKHRAHAHAFSRIKNEGREGWICIERADDISPELLLEELAHLVAKTEGIHDATFQKARRALRRRYRTK
jgi:hypothetical protein